MEYITTHWPLILLIFGIGATSLLIAYVIAKINKDDDDYFDIEN